MRGACRKGFRHGTLCERARQQALTPLHFCFPNRDLPALPPPTAQVDNFELAARQLKLETEGEERVNAAYQGLYKQMVELFRGLGLEATPGG